MGWGCGADTAGPMVEFLTNNCDWLSPKNVSHSLSNLVADHRMHRVKTF